MVLSISLYFIFNYYGLKNKHVTKTQHNPKKKKKPNHLNTLFWFSVKPFPEDDGASQSFTW